MRIALPWLDPATLDFPDPATALTNPNGLLAAGGDLHPARLLEAYRRGIFPWYSDDQPILWWSPDPRMVLKPEDLHISHSLAKTLRSGRFQVTSDRNFDQVLQGCAAPRPHSEGTWLGAAMQRAYLELHRLGHAHSLEVWQGDQLAGGLYGIALDGIFFGESMFSRATDASKVALVTLAGALTAGGYRVIDCQVASPHLASLGARLMTRKSFAALLPTDTDISRPAYWPLQ